MLGLSSQRTFNNTRHVLESGCLDGPDLECFEVCSGDFRVSLVLAVAPPQAKGRGRKGGLGADWSPSGLPVDSAPAH